VPLPKMFRSKDVRAAYASVLLYSMPRWGKTNAIRTLVEQGFRPGILSTDQGDSRGLQTISDLDVPVIPVDNWDEAQLVFAELHRKRTHVEYQGELIDVLVNDSLSGFGSIWMQQGLDAMGWDEVGVAHPGHDPRRIYAYIPEKGRQTMKALQSLPCHLILLARETLAEEGEGQSKVQYLVPELPGAKLPRELPGWLDAVVFGKILNGQRVMMTEAEGKLVAGIRAPESRRFAKYCKPNYGLLIKAMMGDDDALAALKHTPPTIVKPDVPAPRATQASKSTTTSAKGA